jgi:4-diphosphocytidyl-2-C-methyl-D-erythritol kinase
MDKFFYNQQQFIDDMGKIRFSIERENFDGVVAISRGGFTFAHAISEVLNIRKLFSIGAISYNDQDRLESINIFNIPDLNGLTKVLIVDDISDSGRTLNKILDKLEEKFPDTVFKTVTLFYKPSSLHKPDIFLYKTDKWIDFFWSDMESYKKVYKSYAKVNLFLKIVGVRGDYHELFSRFLRVDSLFDKLTLEKSDRGQFSLDGFNFPLEKNIIYKTYLSLLEKLDEKRRGAVEEFFQIYSLKVEKNIPMMAGLGGGSSNSATFLNMVNELLNLELSLEEREEIVKPLGSDIIFFLHNYSSANVTGTGEIVEKFSEESLDIEIFTPEIECNTGAVYKTFRSQFFNLAPISQLESWRGRESKELFRELSIDSANDLFLPAEKLCPNLKKYREDGWLFSGSGSSFFRILD